MPSWVTEILTHLPDASTEEDVAFARVFLAANDAWGRRSFTGWNLMLDEAGGPNVGPFFCGGLVTRNSVSGELSYSGQYKAFRHFTGLTPMSQIYPLTFDCDELNMSSFDRKGRLHTEGCIIENVSGSEKLVLVNPSTEKEQIQYFHCGKWWYIEMLPNTSATIIFEE